MSRNNHAHKSPIHIHSNHQLVTLGQLDRKHFNSYSLPAPTWKQYQRGYLFISSQIQAADLHFSVFLKILLIKKDETGNEYEDWKQSTLDQGSMFSCSLLAFDVC